ncbi:MAG: TetR/AcrR family transcriptional regulator [Bacteroidales bacterium]|nr:TetR/AcrR family transcriptional regulator [Bacteroidales bacterium]
MPKTEKQYKQIRDDRRNEIIDAALNLFATEGYDSTSIARIAKEAKISKGLVYNYFSSKEELLTKVVENAAEDVYQYFDLNNDGVLIEKELKYFIKKMFQIIKEQQAFWRLYLSFAFNPQILEIITKKVPKKSENILEMLVDYFRRQGNTDPEGETFYFISVLKGIAIQYIAAPEYFPLEKMEKKLTEQFCKSDKKKKVKQ